MSDYIDDTDYTNFTIEKENVPAAIEAMRKYNLSVQADIFGETNVIAFEGKKKRGR